jgi:hypothetical protein
MKKNDVFKRELSAQDSKDARKFERIVEKGQLGYVETGLALKEIRDRRLYAGQFRDYVKSRFEMRYHDACRMIRAAEVAKNLRAAELPVPRNEAQAHALHVLTAGEQVEVWKKVLSETERPTAKMIDDIIRPKPQVGEVSVEDFAGTVDLSSALTIPVEQTTVFSSLTRVIQELESVQATAIFGETVEGLEVYLKQMEELIEVIRSKATPITVAA